jgi:uncharacterized protein
VPHLISPLVQRLLHLPPPIDRDVRVERSVRIPVDDGVHLLADVYTPAGDEPTPTVLVRTPYGRAGPLGLFLGRVFAERGYRVVVQSCRGTFGSGGVFRPNFHERADGLATIRWIEAQPWFDGRLAMNGPSYLGEVQWAVGDDAGPSMKALCTHVTYSKLSLHWYPSGSFSLGGAIEWSSMVSEQETARFNWLHTALDTRVRKIDRVINHLPMIELDELVVGHRIPFWREFVEHPSVEDPFWDPIDHRARVGAVTAPVLQVGGWYDIFLPIQVADHHRLVAAGRHPRLVIGPWTHTAPQAFSAQLVESLRWLDRHVRGVDKGADRPPVRLFVMGADEWRDFERWPPSGSEDQRWHLHAGGRLDARPPDTSEPDRYDYDPADPTPIVGGTLLRRTGGRRDQARTERRPDVVVYTSDELDEAVDVIGAVSAEMHVSSNLEHFDVFVRLCDVDTKGRSTNVCDGIERVSPARHPRPGDGVWAVPVELWPTAHRFRAGHRIRIQVSSGAHPRFVRNLGTEAPIGTATELRISHQAVHHDPGHPSAVTLPILRG